MQPTVKKDNNKSFTYLLNHHYSFNACSFVWCGMVVLYFSYYFWCCFFH